MIWIMKSFYPIIVLLCSHNLGAETALLYYGQPHQYHGLLRICLSLSLKFPPKLLKLALLLNEQCSLSICDIYNSSFCCIEPLRLVSFQNQGKFRYITPTTFSWGTWNGRLVPQTGHVCRVWRDRTLLHLWEGCWRVSEEDIQESLGRIGEYDFIILPRMNWF